jgi:uncharacterized protein (TIGR03435 family)
MRGMPFARILALVALAPAIAPSQTPRFEIASVKPCAGDPTPGARGGSSRGEDSPGRLTLNCATVKGLIQGAYVLFADGRLHPAARVPITGGPAWIESETYEINASAGAAQTQAMMRGPMMQQLLEERFNLIIRREIREIPAYALVVAKGGVKLEPFREGTCNPIDFTSFPPVVPENPCRSLASEVGPNVMVEAQATTIEDFCRFFLGRLDRPSSTEPASPNATISASSIARRTTVSRASPSSPPCNNSSD